MKELISACHLYGMPDAAVMVSGDMYSIRWPRHWKIHQDDPEGMVKSTNRLFELYPDEPYYGFLNDRARPHDEDWINRLMVEVRGGWANQAPLRFRNGKPRMKNGIMDGNLVRKRGWFWPPFLRHLYVDDVMEDLLYSEGLFHQTDVIIDEVEMPKHPRLVDDKKAYEAWLRS